MTTQAFIIPRNATPDDIERARPYGAGDRRWSGGRGAGRRVPDTAAVNRPSITTIRATAPRSPQPIVWWQVIIDGLWHAYAAGELCDTWDRDDLANEMADQLWAEARRLTQATEEEVRVPNAAFAALAHIRNQEPAP